jgi:hypothetical protein
VVVTEEIVSPELVLVSPPEIAARARQALEDFEPEWQVVVRLRAEAAAAAVAVAVEDEPQARLTFGAVAFTILASATSLAPLVLLILLR